jgi:hypothetical protein
VYNSATMVPFEVTIVAFIENKFPKSTNDLC